MSVRLAVAIGVGGALLAACTGHSPAGPRTLASITVTPNVSLAITDTQRFIAVGKDADGAAVAISPVWSVVAGGGVINNTGLFTAGTGPGTFANTVQATSGHVSGTATVTVTTGPLATITVTPTPVTLPITGTQQFTAVGQDAGGNLVAIAPTWAVVAGGGAITNAGLFTAATGPGTFANTVQATSGRLSGTATVAVTTGPLAAITVSPTPVTLPIAGTQQFTAVGQDAGGNVVAIAPTWTVGARGGCQHQSGAVHRGDGARHLREHGPSHERAPLGDRDGDGHYRAIGDHHSHPHPGHPAHHRHPAIHGGGHGCRRQRRRHRAHVGSGGRGRCHHQYGAVHRGDGARHLREHGPGHEWASLGDRDGHGHYRAIGDHHCHPHPGHPAHRRGE